MDCGNVLIVWYLVFVSFVLFVLYSLHFIIFTDISTGKRNPHMREDHDITVKKLEIYNWKTIITTIETEIY